MHLNSLVPRRLQPRAPRARALLGRGLPAAPGAAAAEPPQAEPRAHRRRYFRSALRAQPDGALPLLWYGAKKTNIMSTWCFNRHANTDISCAGTKAKL